MCNKPEALPQSEADAEAPVDNVKDSSSPALEALRKHFPGAIPNTEFVQQTFEHLEKYGYNDETSLLATSLCCDEVNRVLCAEFRKVYHNNFMMGGLAGFPFGGVTSFGAMAHHIPDDGSCLVLYGPHVGIDSAGNVGKVDRRGRSAAGACCGSAADACNYVCGVRSGTIDKQAPPKRPLDAQQAFVRQMLTPYGRRLVAADVTNVELPFCMFDAMDDMMQQIVTFGSTEVAGEGNIALLGGIQINTPNNMPDYFLPIKFQVRDNHNLLIEDLMCSGAFTTERN